MDTEKYPNIVITEGVLSGAPRINGRRLAVGDVVSRLKWSDSIEEVEGTYQLNKDEIKESLEYCANQQCLKDEPLKFCHNCSLRTAQEDPLDLSEYRESEINGEQCVIGEGLLFLGSLSDFVEDYNGTDWWIEAVDLLAMYGTGFKK